MRGPGETQEGGTNNYIVDLNRTIDRPIDLSSLLYDEVTVFSQALYVMLLITSISSVCIDLAKILKWGDKPIINTYLSFTFLKIFLFILTKFLVQSYALSMAIKSLMYNVAIQVDFEDDSDLFKDMFNIYYRGINDGPQLLTFNQATLYLPLSILGFIFIPSIISTFFFSVWSRGLKSWTANFVQNFVLLLFAVMSSMSYFSAGSENRKQKTKKRPRSQSLPDLNTTSFQELSINVLHSSESVPALSILQPVVKEISVLESKGICVLCFFKSGHAACI